MIFLAEVRRERDFEYFVTVKNLPLCFSSGRSLDTARTNTIRDIKKSLRSMSLYELQKLKLENTYCENTTGRQHLIQEELVCWFYLKLEEDVLV